MTKTVQVSVAGAAGPWLTLPGGTGDLSSDRENITDTIFGSTFDSTEVGLIGWTANANALYKGFGGYVADISQTGSTTAMVAEPMTLETGKIYRVTDLTRDVWDRSATFTVFDTAADQNANVEWIDYLFGRIKFLDAYTPTGAITVTGSFFPLIQLGKGNSFTLTQTAAEIDTSDFATVQGNGFYRTWQAGLRTVSLDISGIYDVTQGLRTALTAGSELLVEVNPDGAQLSMARGFFRSTSAGQSGDVGALEEETVTLNLRVPDQALLLRPFGWVHESGTTLSASIQGVLNHWEDPSNQALHARYLHDGTNGVSGEVIATDVTLSGGLDVMNEFTVSLRGTGAQTTVGTG